MSQLLIRSVPQGAKSHDFVWMHGILEEIEGVRGIGFRDLASKRRRVDDHGAVFGLVVAHRTSAIELAHRVVVNRAR